MEINVYDWKIFYEKAGKFYRLSKAELHQDFEFTEVNKKGKDIVIRGKKNRMKTPVFNGRKRIYRNG